MNVYEVLGLKTGVSDNVIVRAYRKKLRDIEENLSPEKAKTERDKLDFANGILSDPRRRAQYDKLLSQNADAADFDRLYQKYTNAPPKKPVKMPLGKRTENFWYHYKVLVIIGLFIVAVGAFLIVSRDKSPKADLRILLTGEYFFSERHEEILTKALAPYIADRNGDSLQTLNIINTAAPPASTELFSAYRSKFMAELSLGDKVLLILDEPNMRQLSESAGDIFSDLSLYEPSLPPKTYSFPLSSSPVISKAFAGSQYELPDGMLAVLFTKNEDKYAKKGAYKNIYDDSVALFKAMANPGAETPLGGQKTDNSK